MCNVNGEVIPPNFVDGCDGRFVQFTADNIDINDSTLDGKNTFHATQMEFLKTIGSHMKALDCQKYG